MGWEGGTYGKKDKFYSVWTGKDEGKRPPGNLRVDGKIILKWIVSKYDGEGVDLINLVQERTRGGLP